MQLPIIRVFVSSTWLDMQPERTSVEAALQRLRETKFVGMEYFGSRDETTRETSLAEVDYSQVYVGIVGGRYGSGITEREYRRARKLNLSCLIYFKDETTIPLEGLESDQNRACQLAALKAELRQSHTITYFSAPDDLAAKLTADLHRWLFDKYLVQGITALPTDYAMRIQNFLTEYLGTFDQPVPFGGRENELARLDSWLDEAAGAPYLLLSAPAGRGKSALLVRWSRQVMARDDLTVIFIPISIRFRTNLGGVVFAALTARLAALHGVKVPWSPDASGEIWRGMATEYLSRPLSDGRRLLLILDGVDEAADWQPGPDLFPLAPPPGLHVVVSTRPVAGDIDAAPWLRRLGWERRGLAHTLTLDPLTQEGVADVLERTGFQLSYLGAEVVDMVAELHRLSEGDPLLVNLYMNDLRVREKAGFRLRPENLRSLRPGLDSYFERWWDDQRIQWGHRTPMREPLVQAFLNLLSCALGPLMRADVLSLASEEAEVTTWTLLEALQPLARFVIGDGQQQGYVFSHPRLGAYFYGKLAAPEQRAWESRFLTWGEKILKALNEGELPPKDAPSYLVQYYGTHLERGGAPPKKLLSLVTTGWRHAWEAFEGSYAGFITDVERAWRAAERADEQAASAGYLPPFLAEEVHSALCRASLNSLAQNIPPILLAEAVRAEIWSTQRALAYARRIPNAARRAEVLTALAPHLPEPQKEIALREALRAVRAIGDELAQIGPSPFMVNAITALVPHLPEPLQGELVHERLERASGTKLEDWRGWVLALLAPRLPEPQRTPAIEEALGYIKAMTKWRRARALAALAPHLPESLLQEALVVARGIDDEWARVKALVALAPCMDEAEKLGVLRKVLVARCGGEWVRMQALSELTPHLPEPLLREAIVAARGINKGTTRTWALLGVAPYLPEPLVEADVNNVCAEIRAISYLGDKVRALTKLASHLPESLLHEALAVAREFGNSAVSPTLLCTGKAEGLACVAPYLPEPLKGEVLQEALAAARAIGDRWYLNQAQACFSRVPREPLGGSVLKEPLSAAGAIQDEWSWQEALSQAAARAIQGRTPGLGPFPTVKVLARLAPHLPESLLHEALAAARAIPLEDWRASVLARLSPHLSEPLKGAVQQEALAAVLLIEGEWARVEGLAELAPHLPEPLLQEALSAVQAIKGKWARVEGLVRLAPYLPESLKGEVLQEALAGMRTLAGKWYWVEALLRLAPYLPEPLKGEVLQEALAAARALENWNIPGEREQALAFLVPYLLELPLAMLYRLWRETLWALSARTRLNLLLDLQALAPVVAALGGASAISKTFHAIQEVGRWWE